MGKNSSGGQYGSSAAAVAASFVDDYSPTVMLFKQFSATGATASVAIPSGVGQCALQTATSGGPTSATVVVEGSNDGNTWTALPGTNQPPGSARYTRVRLNCTALAGGASPTITAAALVSP
jgi:hypothetical protein